jgi:hypothetical protein
MKIHLEQEGGGMNRHMVALTFVALTGGLLSGCAQIEKSDAISMERDLAAAGFQMKFAKSPAQIAKVGSLPQRKLTRVAGPDGKPRFVWADAADCRCFYVGTESAYDRFQRLSISQQSAEENEMAAQMDWDTWGPWGPWW